MDMKKFGLIVSLLFLSVLPIFAQILEPVKWEFSKSAISETEYELVFSATIEDGWHLYSTDIPDGGPVRTSFSFDNKSDFKILGSIQQVPEPEKHFDPTFQMDLSWFSHEATFVQRIEVPEGKMLDIKGHVEFMVCNDETCLPPTEIEYSFVINEGQKQDEVDDILSLPEQVEDEVGTAVATSSPNEDRNYFSIFILAFLSGFAALLTPCVFPMIPMTVSFFTKSSDSRAKGVRNAVTYGASIIIIYVILGTVVTAIFGAESLNSLSTNPWFNLIFAILLFVFAFSFMGAFEIVLPHSWVNAIDRKADKGGLIGIFFMAFALALVSFSCTGPIVGSLIVEAARNGGLAPIIGMLGFSSALALPFGLFAAFPSMLNSLPRSGGWLNSVKVVLGFLEFAFAFKFLSISDMVLDLHLLEREIYLSIWIAIFFGLAMYLWGKIVLPHDSPKAQLPVSRFVLGTMVLSFVIYMVPGLWGAPVKIISGFPPPVNYAEAPQGFGASSVYVGSGKDGSVGLNRDQHLGPHGIPVFYDFEKALDYSKQVYKPLLVDFTGKGCTNCRKMEDNVWVDPGVKKRLSEDVVVVSLYVDLRKELPKWEQYTSKTTKRRVKTVGNKWTDFQIERFSRNTQPFYVILGPDNTQLGPGMGYNPNPEIFIEFLDKGTEVFSENYDRQL
ncbi:protein-disulfide reductase DsbD family protein [Prolixibacteraceae bacterium]|nr:protein-disulfide reductase DsbD family protein [Prolixibacteraceae bacterium]